MRKKYNTLVRKHNKIYTDDPRLSDEAKSKVPFHEWQQVNQENLHLYNITVQKILSPLTGTSTETLRQILVYEHLQSSHIVDKFILWLQNNSLKKIEWEESTTIGVMKPVLYLSPRTRITVIDGAASTFIPRTSDRDDGEILK